MRLYAAARAEQLRRKLSRLAAFGRAAQFGHALALWRVAFLETEGLELFLCLSFEVAEHARCTWIGRVGTAEDLRNETLRMDLLPGGQLDRSGPDRWPGRMDRLKKAKEPIKTCLTSGLSCVVVKPH